MKRFSFFASICAAFLLCSCDDIETLKDFNLPESVSVKSKATYELAVGNSSFSVAEQVSVATLKESLGESNESLSVFDYNPTETDSDVLQYILNYDIANIPLSVSTNSDINEITFDTSFTAPDFSQTVSDGLTLTETLTVYEPGTESGTLSIPLTFNIISPEEFEYMYIRKGTFDVSVTPPANVSADFEMEAMVTLTDQDGNILAEPSDSASIANGGTLSLTLDGSRLVQEMIVLVTGSIEGGSLGTKLEYTVNLAPNNVKFDKITGLTMSNDELGDNGSIEIDQTFELTGMNSALKSATVESGSLSFSCVYPEGWSGIKIIATGDKKTEFTLTGGINIEKSEFRDDPAEFGDTSDTSYILYRGADIATKEVKPESVSTTGSKLVFRLEKATIVFADEGKETSITLNGRCKIDSLSNLEIDISALDGLADENGEMDTGLSFSTLLNDLLDSDEDETLQKLIKTLEFSDIDGYLFITEPTNGETLQDLSFSGYVSASYTKDGVVTTKTLVDSSTLSMRYSKQDLASLADENSLVTSDELFAPHENESENLYSAKMTGMTELLNDQPDDLKIAYNLQLSGNADTVTLSGDALEKLADGSSSINVSVAIILPFKFRLNDCADDNPDDGLITIEDVLALADNEITDDLLKRDEGEEPDWQKYTDLIEAISLNYTVANNTPLKMQAIFTDDAGTLKEKAEDGTVTNGKKLDVTSGSHTFAFSKDDVDAIIKQNPFCPKIKLEIMATDNSENTVNPFIVTRDAAFGFPSCAVRIKTNGTVEVWNKND